MTTKKKTPARVTLVAEDCALVGTVLDHFAEGAEVSDSGDLAARLASHFHRAAEKARAASKAVSHDARSPLTPEEQDIVWRMLDNAADSASEDTDAEAYRRIATKLSRAGWQL